MRRLIIAALLLGALTAPSRALAVTILSFGDSRSIGLINDGIPSNLSDTAGYINTLIGLSPGTGPITIGTETYTRTSNTFGSLPGATAASGVKQDTSTASFNLGSGGWTYLAAKYDAGNAGMYVWYVAGLTGVVTYPSTFSGDQYGLSHTSVFGSSEIPPPGVPDGGATAILLGFALGAVALLRRRLAA